MAKIYDVIKYEGDNDVFIWKHPCEDFNSLTQLIVHESQEAIFFMNGQALDQFGPGRYTLETQNIPKIGKVFNRMTKDDTPFHCEVYFINKTEQMAIKWGTDTRVEYMEPTYHFPISIGASGTMNLRVSDGRKLLIKIVGTENVLTQQKIAMYFRSFLMTKIKTYIAHFMRENSVSIFEIDEHLETFSNALKEALYPDFDDYGVSLERFFVTTVAKPEDNKDYKRFKDLHFRQYADITEAKLKQQLEMITAETEAKKTILESEAIATKRTQEGYTYQQERGFDVANVAAENEAIGQFSNLGIGLGTMVGVGGTMGGMVTSAMNSAINTSIKDNQEVRVCKQCGAAIPANAKFCLECGQKVEIQNENEIICPTCNKKTAQGKFCMECGAPLEIKCAKCGSNVPVGAKFCLECGEKL